jgi:hypothetical protein
MKGSVYVLINPAFPEFVKVGYTERSVEVRMTELSNTSLPSDFVLIYKVETEYPRDLEAAIHQRLDDLGYRYNSQREFFNAPIPLVIDVVIEVSNSNISIPVSYDKGQSNLELAFDYRLGRNGVFKDEEMSKKLLRLEYQSKNYASFYPYFESLSKAEKKKNGKKILVEGASNGCLNCSIGLLYHWETTEYSLESVLMSLDLFIKNYTNEVNNSVVFASTYSFYGQDTDDFIFDFFEVFFSLCQRYFKLFPEFSWEAGEIDSVYLKEKMAVYGMFFQKKYHLIFNVNRDNFDFRYYFKVDEEDDSRDLARKATRQFFYKFAIDGFSNDSIYKEYLDFIEKLEN